MVRHGMNRSRGAVSEPIRASTPSETTRISLAREQRRGCPACRSEAGWYAPQIVASSSAAFFNSTTASGSPLTKTPTSGRRGADPRR